MMTPYNQRKTTSYSLNGSLILPVTLALCLVMLFGFLSPAFAQHESEVTIYFYSSELNTNKFNPLKTEFDAYLSQFGSYTFQPFDDRETFEQEIAGQHNCLIILSSWHFSNIYEKYGLNPVFVGERNGEKYEKRVLVATQTSAANVEAAQQGVIASSSTKEHSRGILREMFQDPKAAEKIRFFPAPKDIDSLLNLGYKFYGLKAALVTEHSFEQLQQLRPELYKQMYILAESKKALLPVMAVSERAGKTDSKALKKLLQVFQDMSENQDGKLTLKLLLGLDDWQTPDDKDMLHFKK